MRTHSRIFECATASASCWATLPCRIICIPLWSNTSPLDMKTVLAALLLALAIGQAAATCAQVKGVSSTFGKSDCGSAFDEQSTRPKDSQLRKVTLYYLDGCINGLRTEFGGKGGDKSNTYGQAKGEEKSISLGWSEYITDVDINRSGNCIGGLKLTSNKGNSVQAGAAGTYLAKALSNAYVYGFKGTAGNCGVGSLAIIWAVEECAQAVPKPAPVPTPVEVPVPVPVPTPKPVPTPVDKPVPVPVDRPVPVPTPVDKPTPVPVDRPVPVPTPVDKPVPVPVDRPVPVPTPVDKPVPVPVERPVPVPTPVDKPVPVPVPVPKPVPTPVQTSKTITIAHPFGKHFGRKML